MKSQSDLHVAVLKHQGQLLGVDTSLDISTLMSSIEQQGEQVLTLWLPQLGTAFERSLGVESLLVKGHPLARKRSKTDERPAFLHGFWALVFDADGVLLVHPSVEAIRAIRQICHLHGKLKELPTPERVEAALNGYVDTDNQVSQVLPADLLAEFRRAARQAWGPDFSRMESHVYHTGFLPGAKHGPGAVAEKLPSNQKWNRKEWTERLERYFRSTEFLEYDIANEGDDILLHPPGSEPPARVVCVPKTAKAPRVITIEPVYNQFVQQGLMSLFTAWMYEHPQVSFEFREPNMQLAKAGSVDGSLATIDLSEASDRISLRLVKELFGDHKYLLGAILSCRSMTSELPDGSRVSLRKFASMGSALTFPIQTLVFATIARMAVERTSAGWPGKTTAIRVYGDDIIVPTYAALETMFLLEAFGLKVNHNKSFWSGNFRESCGGEYFKGSDVSVVRARKRLPSSRRDVEEVVANVAFRNLYFSKYGSSEVVTILDEHMVRLIPLPWAPEETPGLVRWTWEYPVYDGFDSRIFRPYVFGMIPTYHLRRDILDEHGALLKFFWTPFNEDPKHLQRAGRPISAKLRYGKIYL